MKRWRKSSLQKHWTLQLHIFANNIASVAIPRQVSKLENHLALIIREERSFLGMICIARLGQKDKKRWLSARTAHWYGVLMAIACILII